MAPDQLRPGTRRRVAPLGLAAAILLLPSLASAFGGGEAVPCPEPSLGPAGCPDLIVDAHQLSASSFVSLQEFEPDHCAVVEELTEPGTRRLLRFALTTTNVGPQHLVVGSPYERTDLFQWSPCHGHYHFGSYADYRLWLPESYAQWVAVRAANPLETSREVLEAHPELAAGMVAGRKQGFCIMETGSLAPLLFAPGHYSCYRQGLAPGWSDTYHAWLDGQWIDVSGLDGYYVLEAEVNPERIFGEGDYGDNAAAALVFVPVEPL